MPAVNQPSREEQELNTMREALPEAGPLAPESAAESLPAETEPEKVETPPESVPVDEQKPVETVVEKPLSERANKRFQEMAQARKEAEERAAQLEAERNNLLQVMATKQEIEEVPTEITPEQYQADVAKKAEHVVKTTLHQERELQKRTDAQKYFLEDYKEIQGKYGVLNDESPEYDAELDQMVGDYYEVLIQKDPSIRLTSVVDKFIKQREKGVESAKRERINKVAKQASQQAIAPSGGETTTTSYYDRLKMVTNDEELEAIKSELPYNP